MKELKTTTVVRIKDGKYVKLVIPDLTIIANKATADPTHNPL